MEKELREEVRELGYVGFCNVFECGWFGSHTLTSSFAVSASPSACMKLGVIPCFPICQNIAPQTLVKS